MSNEDLKHKVIKLAQAYRSERIRNEYFEKALKSANMDLAHTKRMATELETVKGSYQKLRVNFSNMNKEIQKIGLYKDTIRKQETVIIKLEALLDKTLKETQKAREGILELEKLKTENLVLQQQLRADGLHHPMSPRSEAGFSAQSGFKPAAFPKSIQNVPGADHRSVQMTQKEMEARST